MFRGVSKISFDAKGRFAVPAKYRAELQDICANQLIITVDPDQCLLMYPKPNWLEVESDLMQQGNLNKGVRRLKVFRAMWYDGDPKAAVLVSMN